LLGIALMLGGLEGDPLLSLLLHELNSCLGHWGAGPRRGQLTVAESFTAILTKSRGAMTVRKPRLHFNLRRRSAFVGSASSQPRGLFFFPCHRVLLLLSFPSPI